MADTFLGQIVQVRVDRPLGLKHSDWGHIYLVNYRYVPDTVSTDGEELDVYILGVFEPMAEFKGR